MQFLVLFEILTIIFCLVLLGNLIISIYFGLFILLIFLLLRIA